MKKKFAILLLSCISGGVALNAQTNGIPETGTYLGEPKPAGAPRMFAPGKVSDGLSNRDMAISPSGDELFYTIQGPAGGLSVILYMHFDNGKWSGPEMAPFSGRYGDLEPAFSYDGKTLYFSSNRPIDPGSDKLKDYDIWMIRKIAGKWGEPIRLDTAVNSTRDEYYPSIARSGNLYFTREMENGKGKEDIVVSEWKDGKYQPAYSLPGAINTDNYEFNAFIDPDEQFLLFSSFGRKGELGGGDLYLSCKNDKGEWTQAVLLDSTVNSNALDFSPFVTFDKKYLFFTSGRMNNRPPFKKPLDFKGLQRLLGNFGNGLNDIYWIEWQPLLKKYCHAH